MSSIFSPKKEIRLPRQLNLIQIDNLISLVQEYADLYDPNSFNYANLDVKESLWQKLSNRLGENVKLCKRTWKLLRYQYNLYNKAKVIHPDNAQFRWEHEDQLKFLQPVADNMLPNDWKFPVLEQPEEDLSFVEGDEEIKPQYFENWLPPRLDDPDRHFTIFCHITKVFPRCLFEPDKEMSFLHCVEIICAILPALEGESSGLASFGVSTKLGQLILRYKDIVKKLSPTVLNGLPRLTFAELLSNIYSLLPEFCVESSDSDDVETLCDEDSEAGSASSSDAETICGSCKNGCDKESLENGPSVNNVWGNLLHDSSPTIVISALRSALMITASKLPSELKSLAEIEIQRIIQGEDFTSLLNGKPKK